MPVLLIGFKDYVEHTCSRGCCFRGSSAADIIVEAYDTMDKAKERMLNDPTYDYRCFDDMPEPGLCIDRYGFADPSIKQWINQEMAKEARQREDDVLAQAEAIRKKRMLP